jgi:plastocyanin
MLKGLIAPAALALALGPGLAFAATPSGSFTAVDYAWRANGSEATTLTIAPGESVTFGYPAGADFHNVQFTGPQPTCEGLTPYPRPKGWTGECTFAAAGTYAFVCGAHAAMKGTVVVAAPAPTASPDPSATPGATATPTPAPPVATPTPPPAPVKLRVTVPRRQKGTRVRGSVDVPQTGSRLAVTVTIGKVRAGRSVQPAVAAGRRAFSVALDAKARRALRTKRRLAVAVTVALTPPGAKVLRRTAKVALRPG